MIDLATDSRVTSDYSAASALTGSMHDKVRAAEERGLTLLGLVAPVSRQSKWIGTFAERVSELDRESRVSVRSGIIAQLLDFDGNLDLPPDVDGAQMIFVAADRFPGRWGPVEPELVRHRLEQGIVGPCQVADQLVEALVKAMYGRPGIVIASPFNVLAEVNLSDSYVSGPMLWRFAKAAYETGSGVEVSERCDCLSKSTLDLLVQYGVELVPSSGALAPAEVGRYRRVAEIAQIVSATLRDREAP